uniref:Indole-3-acetic acid-induced protein ARG7 n=1 Tax=Cajanus cajan TaxID=3821 RepID=A0A151UF80_CAJCA
MCHQQTPNWVFRTLCGGRAPLFKMLLEKAYNEFGFSQRNGLVVPCSVSTFKEVINAIECNNGKFDLGKFFAEFV